MRFTRLTRTLIVAVPLLGVVILHPSVPTFSMPFAGKSMVTPKHVEAGIPFVLRDQYSTQVCISSRSGDPLPPFLVPSR